MVPRTVAAAAAMSRAARNLDGRVEDFILVVLRLNKAGDSLYPAFMCSGENIALLFERVASASNIGGFTFVRRDTCLADFHCH